jgi:putative spermidine/putrescine transport system permease protein
MRLLGIFYCAFVVLFLLAPVAVLIPLSFDGSIVPSLPPTNWSLSQYREFFASEAWLGALGVSVRVALATMVMSIILGTLASFALVRGRFRGHGVASVLMLSPRFVPVIISAIAFYALLAKLRIVGTELGLIVAHTVMAVPYTIIIVSATLRGIDRSLEQASMSLGANPSMTAFKITLPLIRSSMISAALVAFVVSFDEIVVAIFISGTHAATLPKKMWDSLVFEMEPMLPAISTLILSCTLAVFVLVAWARWALNRQQAALGQASSH